MTDYEIDQYVLWAGITSALRFIGDAVRCLLSDVLTPVMAFMLSTPLCVVGLGLSFCGAGFGFVKRALKTSRK